MSAGRPASIFQVLQPEGVDRVFVELGRRVVRQSTSGEDAALIAECEAANKALDSVETCLRCHSRFVQRVNYEYRACKMHPGESIVVKGLKYYSCCGKGAESVGCVSCMHTARQDIFDYMNAFPYHAFAEVSKNLVDSNRLKVSKEIITDYPRCFISQQREIELTAEKRFQEEIKSEDLVYRINMVAIFSANITKSRRF